MSRAVVAEAYGGPEILAVIDEPDRPPGPGEVLLEVRAAGVNPADWKGYSGMWGTNPRRLPIRLGYEVAGVVLDVGPDVDGPAVGDEVVAWPVAGGYAERVVVPARVVAPRPAGLSWAQSAGLLLSGAAATHLLTATRTGADDVVLVHGGSGGVGRLAVQLAALAGARVVATAGPAAHDDLRQLGAIPVAYGPGLLERLRAVAAQTGPFTAALDTAGTDEALDASVALVADRSRIATIAAFDRGAELGIQVLGNGPDADPGDDIRDAARAHLARLADEGVLDIRVARTYPLDDAGRAHEDSRSGHARGKLVLIP
ncbi:NADP-dependent oxidoreductase [Cellulomonas cellasea]|uniref:NADP-dependent oxidoreductase n=1 Tax=Cellulomonas cellasea TaxID=43670 RepID=UPI0025A429A5|nr:NADP-dependent oxidoreductase [Cellulomonas cellasea]MDM8083469.1 NADP-dependent oxidoreductase [Cellulomonas cellasea]